ncbi:MAG: hypothetical protein JWL81_1382 [Verrucomicrobiales bacterium]|nr:hypothetical protein [Verrucomicrobiales bacterium]
MTRKSLLIQAALCATAISGAFLAGRATAPVTVTQSVVKPGYAPVPSGSATGAMAGNKSAASDAKNGSGTGADAGSTPLAKGPMTPEQTASRLKAIFDTEDPVERMTDYLAFLKSLDSNEARTAAVGSLLENFNPREKAKELNMLMSDWASKDPEAALASVKDNKNWQGTMAASTVLSKWVTTNPDAAIAWATENGKEADKTENGNFYMVGLLGTLAKKDLDRAAELAQSMNRSRARGDVMDRVLDQYLSQRTPEATQNWAAGLEAGPFKDGLMGRLASRLAEKDGASAAAWVTSLPDSENKPRVMAEVVQRWSREQPNEAGAWLNSFPPSAATDDPRESFAMQVQKTDPEAAIAWASTITDEKRRERATRDLIRSWAERDPNMVRQWVDTNPVSERIKQRYGTKPNG